MRDSAPGTSSFRDRPRAWPGKHGTFADCEERLRYAAGMGFDVVYLPPIHPIGMTFRKGRNNIPSARAGRPGEPVGDRIAGGWPQSDSSATRDAGRFSPVGPPARDLEVQIALDIAFQISPDHPVCEGAREWFRKRPDGTIQYAENPPKKYQDIYPFDFETEQPDALWRELKSSLRVSGSSKASAFFVWTIRTPRRFPSGSGCITEIKREWPRRDLSRRRPLRGRR